MVYSTCTFAPEEDEQIVAWLLENYDLTLEPITKYDGMDSGRPEFADGNEDLAKTIRLMPGIQSKDLGKKLLCLYLPFSFCCRCSLR